VSAKALTSLDIRKVGTKEWQLLAPLIVLVVIDGKSYLIRVPPGFVTDFASVPRLPLAFFLFGGIGDLSATVHDWLYYTGEYPREVCDAIFRELLRCVDGASAFRANGMYAGVRVGGSKFYAPSTT